MEDINYEALRKRLLDDAYVMAFSGLGAAILDIDEITRASDEELLEIAERSGISI